VPAEGGVVDRTVLSLAHDGRGVHVELAFVPDAVPQARSVVRAHASSLPPLVIADAELLTSEVVSNAVMHGAPPLVLDVVADDDHLLVRVSDGSEVVPSLLTVDSDPDSVSGRGLRIVQLVASAWGIETTDRGKTVWFRVAVTQVRPPQNEHNHPEEIHPWS
jgi:anti-sigma regulatory factor (Ser/Thr protein kinase)